MKSFLAQLQRPILLVGLVLIWATLQGWHYIYFTKQCRKFAAMQELPMPYTNSGSKLSKEVIVVLTGDRDRIATALDLLKKRDSDLLIISGTPVGIPLLDIIQNQKGASQDIHTLWDKILIESHSSTTIENAKHTRMILKEKTFDRVILVTSDYHLPRAYRIFQHTLFNQPLIPFASNTGCKATAFSEGDWKDFFKFQKEYWKYFFFQPYYFFSGP